MLFPQLFLVLAEVALKRLLSPRAVYGVGDGGECGDGLILARVLQELKYSFQISMRLFASHPFVASHTNVNAPCPPMLCPVMLTRVESN